MLQEAVARTEGLIPVDQLFISTNTQAAELVREQVPQLPEGNCIIEPSRKDTAAAVGLESIRVRKQFPGAIVASLGSDHSVKNAEELQRILGIAEHYIQEHPETIMPIAVQPTSADDGYGYIEYEQEPIATVEGTDIFAVKRFTEKPDRETAKEFIAQGNYLWNANMFVWHVDTILDLYKEHMPEMYAQLERIEAALDTPEEDAVLAEVWPQLQELAVDVAILEKVEAIATIPANIGWNDIGDWSRLKDELSTHPQDNVAIAETHHIDMDTSNTLTLANGKTVVTIGVNDLVIVDTDDALFVAHKNRASDIKGAIDTLKEEGKDELL